jgi:hypothetical protein
VSFLVMALRTNVFGYVHFVIFLPKRDGEI